MTAGRFIVMEGVDGSGTSTQARAVAAALKSAGRSVMQTFEPSDGPIGRLLREYLGGHLQSSGTAAADRRLFAYLFAADRHDHLERMNDGVKHALGSGHDVICARYVLSSLAYEGDNPEELHLVETLNARFPTPDLTVYLDCPVEVALERIANTRDSVDVFENREKLERVRENYRRLLSSYSGRCLLIDAQRDAEEITAEVMTLLATS